MAGTTQQSILGTIGYDEESSFADSATSTYDKVLQVRDATLDVTSVEQQMIPRGGVFGRPNQGDFHIPGPFTNASISFTMDLYGHGSATNTTLTETPLARLLGHVFGVSDATQVGAALTGNQADVSDPITSTGATLVAGGIFRVGAFGDGRNDGQALANNDDSANPFTILTDTVGLATTADAVRAMLLIYHADTTAAAHLTSDGTAVNNTLRFWVGTGTKQWWLRGCACTAISFDGLNTAETPSVTFTFTAASWDDADETWPSATAPADFAPAPNANGSFYIQDVGTQDRNLEVIRNFSMQMENNITPIIGPGGANVNQVIKGWVRGRSRASFAFDTESVDASTTPTWSNYWNTDPNTITAKHVMYTLNPTDGRSIALYFRNCRIIGQRPTMVDVDGLNYTRVEFDALGTDDNTPASRAPWILGLG